MAWASEGERAVKSEAFALIGVAQVPLSAPLIFIETSPYVWFYHRQLKIYPEKFLRDRSCILPTEAYAGNK